MSLAWTFGGKKVWIALLVILSVSLQSTFALLPFPLSANQRGTVRCLESPSVTYDVYLPPSYSTNGTPLPILYTLNPGGGGMVSSFQTVCSSLNIVTVGIINSKNGNPWDQVLRDFFAVSRDIRLRVLYDPTAELVGGFSGGGENSFVFSRFRAQHVAGVLSMGGWLGRQINPGYASTDRVQTNLLVARITGTNDTAGLYFLTPDSNYLASVCGALVHDWYFAGGHTIPPNASMTAALQWLLMQRVPAGPTDQADSLTMASDWRSRIDGGQSQAVLLESVNTLMNQPRTWFAYQAQLVVDDLMTNFTSFRILDMSNLAQGDFASDLLYYYARGAATNRDMARYDCSLRALTGVTGTNGDRAGDLYTLLTNFSYPRPLLQSLADQNTGQVNFWTLKDTPGLRYSVDSLTNFVNDTWQNVSLSTSLDSNTVWSATVDLGAGGINGFFRLNTSPLPGTSPPWPPP